MVIDGPARDVLSLWWYGGPRGRRLHVSMVIDGPTRGLHVSMVMEGPARGLHVSMVIDGPTRGLHVFSSRRTSLYISPHGAPACI